MRRVAFHPEADNEVIEAGSVLRNKVSRADYAWR